MPFLVTAAIWFGGLGLAPGEQPLPTAPPAGSPVEDPGGPASPLPGIAAWAGLTLVAAAALRGEPGDALGLRPPPDALVVFVPGHGQGEPSDAFDDLIDLMGLDPDDARFFDYRWVTGQQDAVTASETAGITEAVVALNSYLGAVASEGRPVWIVGFSKGGATVADLVAAWDDGAFGPQESVAGAFLLDPPISAGAQGWLQSLGRAMGPIPDDGGYDPVQCRFLFWGCEDERSHLGEASGVEVLVIRNPNAGITNLGDAPDGLRIVDAADDGLDFWQQMWTNPFSLPARVDAAHNGVIHDPAVARCVVAEMWEPGSCDLPRSFPPRLLHPSGRRWRRAPSRMPAAIRPF